MYIEIGYPKDAVINVEEQLALTLENLRKSGVVSDSNRLVAHSTIIMDPAYVHITHETDQSIRDFRHGLSEDGIYTIGRYGGWTYCSMEDCMIEARDLVADISK